MCWTLVLACCLPDALFCESSVRCAFPSAVHLHTLLPFPSVCPAFLHCAPVRWTKELGDKLVAQYQQYLQQQISSGRDLSMLNPEDETGCEDNNSCGDCDEEAPYTLGRHHHPKPHKGILQGNSHQQQQQQQQQGMQQGGASASGNGRNQQQQQQQRPPAGRSNSGSFGKSPFGGLSGLGVGSPAPGGGRYHKEHHGLVGRSASMTVPHSWQAMTSSLFGVGVVPAAEKGTDKTGWGMDG